MWNVVCNHKKSQLNFNRTVDYLIFHIFWFAGAISFHTNWYLCMSYTSCQACIYCAPQNCHSSLSLGLVGPIQYCFLRCSREIKFTGYFCNSEQHPRSPIDLHLTVSVRGWKLPNTSQVVYKTRTSCLNETDFLWLFPVQFFTGFLLK